MTKWQDFQRSIHTSEYWEADDADWAQLMGPYSGVTAENLTPEVSAQLHAIALQEIRRVGLVAKALALEVPAPKPQRRTRAPRANGQVETPRPTEISINANTEQSTVELLGIPLSPEAARELAGKLTEAASMVEGKPELQEEV